MPSKTIESCARIRDGGESEFVESFNLVGNRAEDRADRAALVEEIRAEARQTTDAEREVEFEVLFKPVLLRVRQHAVGERLRVGGGERADALDGAQVSVHAHLRRRVRRQVEVRAAHLYELLQQVREREWLLRLFLTRHNLS